MSDSPSVSHRLHISKSFCFFEEPLDVRLLITYKSLCNIPKNKAEKKDRQTERQPDSQPDRQPGNRNSQIDSQARKPASQPASQPAR
jgi:hypothetical protein